LECLSQVDFLTYLPHDLEHKFYYIEKGQQMITKVNATLIMVKDFEASVKFYRDTLEFKQGADEEGFASFDIGSPPYILAVLDITKAADMISEEAVQPSKEFIPRSLFAVWLDDFDAEYESLKAKGVHFIKPPTTQPWGQRTAYFTDPDGNIWEISHFPKES
jgi:lactoylglutathione lyase